MVRYIALVCVICGFSAANAAVVKEIIRGGEGGQNLLKADAWRPMNAGDRVAAPLTLVLVGAGIWAVRQGRAREAERDAAEQSLRASESALKRETRLLEQSQRAAEQTQKNAFSQQLADQTLAPRAERRPDGDFALASSRASKHQVGHVPAGD